MDPKILLVVGVVGLAGCIFLLLLGLRMLREERSPKSPPAAELPHTGSPAPETADAAPAVPRPEALKPAGANPLAGMTARFTGGTARGNAHEVLRVLRDNLTGRLTLEIAGKRYASLEEVREGDVRQGLMTTLQDLEAFAAGTVGPVAGSIGPAAGAVSLAADAPPAPPARPVPATKAARPTSDVAAEYRPLPPPSMNPFKQMAVLRELSKNPPPEPKSIAEQIDDVLQEHILGTPLIHRGLHVRPGLRGDAQFEADGQTYTSVDELPDVEVRDVIRAAIAEWENKQ